MAVSRSVPLPNARSASTFKLVTEATGKLRRNSIGPPAGCVSVKVPPAKERPVYFSMNESAASSSCASMVSSPLPLTSSTDFAFERVSSGMGDLSFKVFGEPMSAQTANSGLLPEIVAAQRR